MELTFHTKRFWLDLLLHIHDFLQAVIFLLLGLDWFFPVPFS